MTGQELATSTLIGLLLMAAVLAYLYLRDNHRNSAEDTRLRTQWEQEVAGVTMPDWDGQNWDWPETGLRDFLNDVPGQQYEAPAPVPVSRVSGPFRMLVPAGDTDAFITAMHARTDAFIALLNEPLSA
ncbi:MAG TPA: hypothetical protein VGG75_38565 [Trebonia sp.]